MQTQHHNVLSRAYLVLLLKYRTLSADSPKCFQNLDIFTTGVLRAMRPTAVALLKRHQFVTMLFEDKMVWKIVVCVGSTSG